MGGDKQMFTLPSFTRLTSIAMQTRTFTPSTLGFGKLLAVNQSSLTTINASIPFRPYNGQRVVWRVCPSFYGLRFPEVRKAQFELMFDTVKRINDTLKNDFDTFLKNIPDIFPSLDILTFVNFVFEKDWDDKLFLPGKNITRKDFEDCKQFAEKLRNTRFEELPDLIVNVPFTARFLYNSE